MIKVVLDANVYMSALISSSGPCSRIINSWLDGHFYIFTSEEIINEIERVIRYPRISKRHGLNDDEIRQYIKFVKFFSIQTSGNITINAVRDDPGDNMFLSCAVEAKADFIVSGDSHLCNLGSYRKIRIVLPADFQKILNEDFTGVIDEDY